MDGSELAWGGVIAGDGVGAHVSPRRIYLDAIFDLEKWFKA